MTTTPAAPAAAVPAKKSGGYMVLQQDESGYWKVAGSIQGRSADDAVRKYVARLSDGQEWPRALAAVPVKSWKPVKVTARTETKLVVEDVKP